jgi:copper chaperone CopZ
VQYANVTLEKDEVVIEFDKHKLQIAEISDAVANAGYDVRLYTVVEK